MFVRIRTKLVGDRANSAASAKTSFFQPFEHVVAGFLGAELRGEPLNGEERRQVHADDPLSLCVLVSAHLGVDRGKDRMRGGLDAEAGTALVGTIASFDSFLVTAHKIICRAQVPSDVDMVAIKAECGFEPSDRLGRSAGVH